MLTIENLRKSFGGVAAISDVSLRFEPVQRKVAAQANSALANLFQETG